MIQRHGTSYMNGWMPASRKEKQQLAALIPENVAPKPSPVNPSSKQPTRLLMEPPSEDLKSVQKMAGLLQPFRSEDIYKIYAESFISREHLHKIEEDAQNIVSSALN